MHPPVSPIIVQIGPFALHWYGLTMTAAIFLGTLVASRYVARYGRDPNSIWNMLFWVLIPAIVGARLYYVFIQSPRGPDGLDQYLAHPIEILEVWRGGIHIYGAFIVGGIALLLYIRQHKLPVLLYLDAVGPGLLLGQSIGRLGNFFNQELYGPPTTLPWGLRIDAQYRLPPYNNLALYPESVRFHPLFLYEMLWDGIGFALLLWISYRFKQRLRSGDLFLLYVIWALFGRFWIEFLRTDSWFFPGTPFDVVHVLSAIAIVTAVTLLILRRRSKQEITAFKDKRDDSNAGNVETIGTSDDADNSNIEVVNLLGADGVEIDRTDTNGLGSKDKPSEFAGSKTDEVAPEGERTSP